jgi:hypothetical protein
MARIPIPGAGRFYTVEVRDRTGTYDGNLPGNAVIIHHVDPGRSEDAWAYDASVPPGDNSAGEGVMWRPGETFEDVAKQIRVRVDTATTNGFQVTIMYGAVELIFTDGFASGNTNAWTYTIE